MAQAVSARHTALRSCPVTHNTHNNQQGMRMDCVPFGKRLAHPAALGHGLAAQAQPQEVFC